MKRFVILFCAFLITSCTSPFEKVTVPIDEYNRLIALDSTQKISKEYPKNIRINSIHYAYFDPDKTTDGHIILIDSCEYIFVGGSYNQGPMLTHKGNCKYCHKRLEDLLYKIDLNL